MTKHIGGLNVIALSFSQSDNCSDVAKAILQEVYVGINQISKQDFHVYTCSHTVQYVRSISDTMKSEDASGTQGGYQKVVGKPPVPFVSP